MNLPEDCTDQSGFSISLQLGETEQTGALDFPVGVVLPVPEGCDANSVRLFLWDVLDEKGDPTELELARSVRNRTVSFSTTSLGDFAFAGVRTEEPDPDPTPTPPPTYPPQVDTGEGGTVATSPSRPSRGDEVTITPKPNPGQEVDAITVTDRNGNPVEVIDNGNGTYSFTQPSDRVTISVTFRFDSGQLCPSCHLTDVDYVVEKGIMEGMSPTTFSPGTHLTRAQAVQILYNLEGQPTVSGDSGFSDAFGWYETAVTWAAQTCVAEGYGEGTFQPGNRITRQEFAQLLYNYAGDKGCDLTAEGDLSQFPDGDIVADWAEAAMSWANGNGLIHGHEDGTLDARGTTIRAQAANIFMEFDKNLAGN